MVDVKDDETNREILAKYKRLRKLAGRVFGRDDGQDIAQEAIVAVLEGKNVKQRDSFSLVDAVRKPGLRSYDRGGRVTKPVLACQLGDNADSFFEKRFGSSDESERRHSESIQIAVRLISMLKEPELIQIMILYDCYNWTFKEISHCFGVSESRICQRHSHSKKLLEKIAIKEGLSSRKQIRKQPEGSEVLPPDFKIIESLSSETVRNVEVFQNSKACRKPGLGKAAFAKIPKTIFSAFKVTKRENAKTPSPLAKIKLEGTSFICAKMEKKTINFWPQKSN